MNNKPFDKTKPVQTRDGRKACIVAELNYGTFPLVAVITGPSGKEYVAHYTAEGRCHGPTVRHEGDLVNAPEKHQVTQWFNVFRNSEGDGKIQLGCGFDTADDARRATLMGRPIARVCGSFTFTEGDGL